MFVFNVTIIPECTRNRENNFNDKSTYLKRACDNLSLFYCFPHLFNGYIESYVIIVTYILFIFTIIHFKKIYSVKISVTFNERANGNLLNSLNAKR